jgi:hypothetical protein
MILPGFKGETSLYKTTNVYRLTAIWGKGSEIQLGPAQLLRPPDGGGGPKGCTTNPVPVSVCATGCQQTCSTGAGDVTQTCVSANQCATVSCGPCLLPTDAIRQKVLAGLPVDPSTDLVFEQNCQQGTHSFTRSCEKCSDETRISLPWPASDKCISVCTTGFDPASFKISSRDC